MPPAGTAIPQTEVALPAQVALRQKLRYGRSRMEFQMRLKSSGRPTQYMMRAVGGNRFIRVASRDLGSRWLAGLGASGALSNLLPVLQPRCSDMYCRPCPGLCCFLHEGSPWACPKLEAGLFTLTDCCGTGASLVPVADQAPPFLFKAQLSATLRRLSPTGNFTSMRADT